MTDRRTAKYVVTIDIDIKPQNQYGDTLDTGGIRYTKDLNVNNLADIGLILQKLEDLFN